MGQCLLHARAAARSARLDGLMTGLARRTGHSLRLVRMGLEATVLALGWLLGGTVGVGTVVYLVAIGPLCSRREDLMRRGRNHPG